VSFQANKGEMDEYCELAGDNTLFFDKRSRVSRLIHSGPTIPTLTVKREGFYGQEAEPEPLGRLLVQDRGGMC
jgi:hypothetical protein